METVYPKTSTRHGKDQTMEWMQWIKRTVKCKKLQVKKGKKRKNWSSNNSDSETDRSTAYKWKTVVTVSIPLCYRIHLTLFLAVANTGRSPSMTGMKVNKHGRWGGMGTKCLICDSTAGSYKLCSKQDLQVLTAQKIKFPLFISQE